MIYTYDFNTQLFSRALFSRAEINRREREAPEPPTLDAPLGLQDRYCFDPRKERWFIDSVGDARTSGRNSQPVKDGKGIVNPKPDITQPRDGIFVFDNFYLNPQDVRAEALHAPYYPHWLYSALRSQRHTNQTVIDHIAGFMGKQLKMIDGCGDYKLNLEGDEMKRNRIHSDQINDWTGVLFLNKEGEGGTSFYRHRRSGLDKFPSNASMEQFETLWEDGLSEKPWHRYLDVEFKQNRLVMFDASLFHGETKMFGKTLHEGRNVQVFFMKTI